MSATSGQSNKINFCDFDALKKKELQRRQKLRLEQVRTQSKELSTKIRDRVAREKHRQLRNVEEIKRKELLSWKEKHVNNTMADYYYCLSNVGDAHVAAERENELAAKVDEQQRKNRKIAAIRGRDALHKEHLTNVKKNERPGVKRKQQTYLARKKVTNTSPSRSNALEEDDKILSEDDGGGHQLSDSDDELTAENTVPTQGNTSISPEKNSDELADKPMESVFRFSQVSDLIEERRRARSLCDQMLQNEFGTSGAEVHPKYPQQKPTQSPSSYQAKSPQPKPLYAPKSPKRPTKTVIPRSPVNVKGLAPKPHQLSHVDKTTVGSKEGFNSQRGVVPNTRKATIPKAAKAKNVVTPSKSVLPQQRREFVPRFTKPGILKNRTVPEATETASPEKVQFYDHFSRYGKEYDAAPGMVTRETRQPTMDANEAARVQNEMDEVRFQQLDELRRKSDQRSKESLQRNQVRKDYDNLTKELDKLCKEENILRTFAMPPEQFSEDRISQLARNRQLNMNRAFEDICHRPVVITCPPVGSNEISSSSDLNVAASPPPRPDQHQPTNIDPFDSSDSCTSILLGYVDNRSRKLVKDIKQCKDVADGDKRRKLVTLLSRLDDLRKMLMEEIVRNSSLNLEPFYRSVLEVETEKKEILHDPLGNKENGDTNKRMESHETDLEKKIRELFREEQKKAAAAPTGDNTFESVTSETLTSNVDPSEPVKILIEVKNGAKIRKSSHPKKGHAGTLIVVPQQRQHKTSIGSSASTAYRSPPATFHTDLSKILSNQADAKAIKASLKSKSVAKSVEQPPLAHYITRLLGMSQKSVDQLGVSTGSSIATPSDSVIDVAENRSVIDANHLSRVQAKIDDSIRLVKEVDDMQTKNQAEMKKGRDSREKRVEASKEHQTQVKQHAKKSSEVVTKTTAKSKKLTHRSDSIGQGHGGEAAAVEPIIPENSKRIIADLTKQIEKVRQDKQKLLEKTLSSAHSSRSSSGKDFDLTEYKEFAATSKQPSKPAADELNCSSQASDVQSFPDHLVNEESKNLMSTKQIGISFSRDSGIGSSRPVTSTDFRVSPDIKFAEKSLTAQATKGISTDSPFETVDSLAGPEDAAGKSVESGSRKSAKPPISLKRYSPQLVTEHLQPHDLSTINEVETSAASRFNQSTRNEMSGSPVPTPYTKFPTFAEYAKMQEMVSNASSDNDNSCSEAILKKMLEITCLSETDLNYRKLERTRPTDGTINDKSTNTGTASEFIDVEMEMKRRRLLESGDVSSTSTSDSKVVSSSTSSDLLANDFNRIGLSWASSMLKKTLTAQNLESSSSSIKSAPKVPPASGGSSPGDRVNGNPLNIRDFLARELLKRSQLSTSSSMSDSSTLTDQFLKSLITISSESSLQQQATLRTSTPNRNNQSSESEKFLPAHDIGHTAKDEHLFSGESILSSVRGGISQSDETSGVRETSE